MAKSKSKKGSVQSIDTALFDDTITAISNAISSFSSARKRVESSTNRLLGKWEGEGSNSFKKVYKKLKTEMADQEDNLKTVKKDLKNIKSSYEEWDVNSAANMK